MEIYSSNYSQSSCVEGEDSYLPPGFRFHPTDEELIIHYLLRKVLDSNFTGRPFAEVDLNKCEPWELPGKAKMGEKEWYIFSLKDRKYPTGLRTNRATNAGYWKATGKDREIYSTKTNLNSVLVGMKKTLVFYRGRAPKGEKTNWIMHEFRLDGKFAYHYLSRTSKDEWVISRVFHKNIPAATTITGAGGGWKKLTTTQQQFSSSSSSVSLPPLLDASAMSANSVTTTDHESGSTTKLEHVSCFSNPATSSGFNSFSLFDIPPPPFSTQPLTSAFPAATFSSLLDMSSSSGGGGGFGRAPPPFGWSGFPRSLQEHLQFPPLFFPAANTPPPVHVNGDAPGNYGSYSSNWSMLEDQKPSSNELDCMWSF